MIRKIIAATCLLAALAFAAPASADGYRHGQWGGHGKHYSYKYYRHDGAAVFAGGLLLGALIGHLASPPRTVYAAPPPQPALRNCRTIYGTGYVNGRLAEYSGTGCYDAYGNLYAMPGSERFLRYLD
ncbi:MAG: hypothetical protein ABFS30_15140 [Pseudomonadota bacterium]